MASEIKGRIFHISRASPEDGPGLRTVIFLKGCPLNCPWCHNPEGKMFEKLIYFNPKLCINCGECERVCPRKWEPPERGGWRNGCTACGLCVFSCPSGARRLIGEDLTPEELFNLVKKDIPFFKATGGGVTFSGGEPTYQSEFLLASASLFRVTKVHTALETSGYFPPSIAQEIADAFDLILFDVKHVDPDKFRKFTGGDLEIVLENLRYFSKACVPLQVRVPLIPGFNDKKSDREKIESFIKNLIGHVKINYLPYNNLWKDKLRLYGITLKSSESLQLKTLNLNNLHELQAGSLSL